MATCRRNIAQHNRLRVEIIDHQIKSTIAIEVSYRQTSSGPRIRQRASRRRAHSLKLALDVAEKQRLLRVTRPPLMLIDSRINMPVYDKQIQPAIVVIIDKTRGPTEKRNRNLTKARLKRHIREVVIAVVVIKRIRII